jgi:hypothetical protein
MHVIQRRLEGRFSLFVCLVIRDDLGDGVLGTTAALGDGPGNVLRRCLDGASLAVDAVLRVDHKLLADGVDLGTLSVLVLVDGSGADATKETGVLWESVSVIILIAFVVCSTH